MTVQKFGMTEINKHCHPYINPAVPLFTYRICKKILKIFLCLSIFFVEWFYKTWKCYCMNIPQIKINFAQNYQHNRVTNPLNKTSCLSKDTVSFGENVQIMSDLRDIDITFSDDEVFEQLIPQHKGMVYKKVKNRDGSVKKVPTEVEIVNDGNGYFIFNDGKKLVGIAVLRYYKKDYDYDDVDFNALHKDYKEEGIVGDRIEVDYIENNDEAKYGGVAHLADLLEVACCKKLGIKPNIVSLSLANASPLHYKRGKRFVPFELYCRKYNDIYKGKEPNDILKEIVEATPYGRKFNTSKIKHAFLMYMPEDLINKYEAELEEHPIF